MDFMLASYLLQHLCFWKSILLHIQSWFGDPPNANFPQCLLCFSQVNTEKFINSFMGEGAGKIEPRSPTLQSNSLPFEPLSSVQFSRSVVSNSFRPHGLQHARLPCPSPNSGAYSNSRPLSRWCHPAISSSVVPFSSCLQSFPASGCFPMSQFFATGGQSIGVSASASVLPTNIQYWFPLGWTGWISLQSRRLSRVFFNITVQKHQFFGAQLSSQSNSHIHTWLLEKL